MFLIFSVMVINRASGQFGGNNIFEYQAGNIPGAEPRWLSTNYNQLNLRYRYEQVSASVRMEYFLNEFEERNYHALSQYLLHYKSKTIEVKVGNFYEMLGNGLLLRAYEIPSAVYEDNGYRVRHGFYRDIQGFAASYRGKNWFIKGIRGMPLINVLPPTVDSKERRMDLIEALNGGVSFFSQDAEFSYLRNTTQGEHYNYGSIRLTGRLPYDLSYNTELAKQISTQHPPGSFTENDPYAFYFSLNYSGISFGGSLEVKSYRNFTLGSGFNDPPTLVKEHTYKVLNRSTHFPLVDYEDGYQLELYYSFKGGQRITLNNSMALNKIVEVYKFREYFGEYYLPVGDKHSVKVFLDYAQDPFQFEPHRYSGGTVWESGFGKQWSALFELEYQQFNREVVESDRVQNAVVILSFSKAARFSAGFTWEISTDPYQTDNSATFDVIEKDPRHWPGLNLAYKINNSHNISMFAGKRRGGPACTSGICYEVLDFEGIEFRLTSKF